MLLKAFKVGIRSTQDNADFSPLHFSFNGPMMAAVEAVQAGSQTIFTS